VTSRTAGRTRKGAEGAAKARVLYLVRHGETDWNLEPVRCQGWADVPLNERGRAQARELGRSLAGRGIELVVTSHLARARETAELVRDELERALEASHKAAGSGVDGETAHAPGLTTHVELRVDERLAETDRGLWESRAFADIVREDPDTWREYKDHPETFTFPEGESLAAQQHRVLEAVRDAALTGRVALLVTHGGSIRLVRAFLEGRGIESFHQMRVPNGEALEIDGRSMVRRIDAFLSPPAYAPGTG
jgi:broad specificity phosphatase PhoE